MKLVLEGGLVMGGARTIFLMNIHQTPNAEGNWAIV